MDDPRLGKIRSSYDRRCVVDERYDPLLPQNVRMTLERTRMQAVLIRQWLGARKLSDIDILEVGCGTGNNILNLIALGASPHRIVANDLLENRIRAAEHRLPNDVRFHLGDGSRLPDSFGRFDLVLQYVVFSSVLDESLLASLASRMWSILKPGGMVLSYDFVVRNPSNPDVRGLPLKKLKRLFPEGQFIARSLTLAPPLARSVSDKFYPFLAAVPFLRTHCLCAVRKPG
jgi:SAM-dependent methyltransferase